MITVTPAPPPPSVDSLWNGGTVYRENYQRHQITSVTLGFTTTGVAYVVGVPLFAGDLVTTVNWRWGTTGSATPTNWWAALYDSQTSPAILSQSADQTTTAIVASTTASLALGTPQPIPTSGIYYVALMVASASQPTLTGKTLGATAVAGAIIASQKKIVGSSGTGLTTTAPPTLSVATGTTGLPYVVLS